MDKTVFRQAARWLGARIDAGDGPPASRSGEGQSPPTSAATRVRYCCWCGSVTVYPGTDLPTDVIVAFPDRRKFPQRTPYSTSNKGEVAVQDGICEACRQKHFPETVKENP